MINEKNKATRIMKEIVGYFLTHDYYDLDISFKLTESLFTLTITTKETSVPEHFDMLLSELNIEREPDMDEYYNALLGGHDTNHDYTLLGKAVDSAVITLENDHLILTIKRYIS